MSAGKIEIEIGASYAKLEADMKAAAAKAGPGGAAAGNAFGVEFENAAAKQINRHLAQFKQKLIAATSTVGITNGLAAALKAGAEGASIGEALAEGVKSTVFIGSVYSIMESIGNIISGTAEEQAANLAASVRGKMDVERLKAQKDEREASAKAVATRKEDLSEAALERDLAKSVGAGFTGDAAFQRRELDIFQARRKADKDLAEAKSEDEKKLIRERLQIEEDMANNRLTNEISKYKQAMLELSEKTTAQKKKDADELFDAEQKRLEERDRKMYEAVKEIEEAHAAKVDELQKRREEVASAVGSGSTAFGEFKFAAYSPTEKRSIDLIISQELRRIRENTSNLLQNAAQIGFS